MRLSSILWYLAGLLCHQLPDRSPQFQGTVFPLCFRCSGLYLGLLSSFVSFAVNRNRRRRMPELPWAIALTVLTIPFLVDGWANLFGVWSSAGWVRALTGVGVGLALPTLLVPLLQPPEPIAATDRTQRSAVTLTIPLPFVAAVTLVYLLIYPTRLIVFQTLSFVTPLAWPVFLLTFLLAGWRNRTVFSSVFGVAPGGVPLLRSGSQHRSLHGSHLH